MTTISLCLETLRVVHPVHLMVEMLNRARLLLWLEERPCSSYTCGRQDQTAAHEEQGEEPIKRAGAATRTAAATLLGEHWRHHVCSGGSGNAQGHAAVKGLTSLQHFTVRVCKDINCVAHGSFEACWACAFADKMLRCAQAVLVIVFL